MADIKDLGYIQDKWRRRAAASQADYKAGTQRPRVSWQRATLEAADRWNQAITEAASRNAFGTGVSKVSDAEWQKGIQTKGVARWPQGIAAATDKYARKFAPYAEVIRNLQLPPRGPTGDPTNIQRVAAIAEALRRKKLEGGGGA